MFTQFEHFAATSLMGSPGEAPPRQDGHLQFEREWEKLAFGVAIALSKQGYFEWEDFRQTLIETIHHWEATHDLTDPEWDYYQCWLTALEKLTIGTGLIQTEELEAHMIQLLDCKSEPQE
ncbi:nitrile hydratase accessory protein [Acaryochloris sp. IP29b_bin.148]|uniref:nitrile hydratase accessory protein n=1 Tax=Acaryochloris sp. IP29b_bin.148 TaxID=2969218 RepID=UPI00260848DA|nr:nitrile hydratase accessory protein [Acaryochloris sp. IP29b_bin.148]